MRAYATADIILYRRYLLHTLRYMPVHLVVYYVIHVPPGLWCPSATPHYIPPLCYTTTTPTAWHIQPPFYHVCVTVMLYSHTNSTVGTVPPAYTTPFPPPAPPILLLHDRVVGWA